MIERVTPRSGRSKIALITTVPTFVKSLIHEDASSFNRRGIQSVRITQDHCGEDLPNLGDAIVDLYFLPAITGDYVLQSTSNVREIAQRLKPYDLVVDLSEFAALYRRGITTDKDREEFQNKHGQDANLGLLEYQNFLDVICALNTMFGALHGRVVRPREIVEQKYEWGLSRTGKLAITGMSEGSVTSDNDPMWAPCTDTGLEMLMAAVAPQDREKLTEVLEKLGENGMNTLKHKAMFSGYLSDMAGIQRAMLASNDPSFTFDLNDIYEHRRRKYNCVAEAGTEIKPSEADLYASIRKSEVALEESDLPFNLIDYYRISGGPADMRANGVDEATKTRFRSFQDNFEAGMAFVRHWDNLEDARNTDIMNKIVNGWYMSNSCFSLLREARAAGLEVKITSWAIPTLVTNSVGFVPDAEIHSVGIRKAVFGALAELLGQLVDA